MLPYRWAAQAFLFCAGPDASARGDQGLKRMGLSMASSFCMGHIARVLGIALARVPTPVHPVHHIS
mgnify:CR=1 FL=1